MSNERHHCPAVIPCRRCVAVDRSTIREICPLRVDLWRPVHVSVCIQSLTCRIFKEWCGGSGLHAFKGSVIFGPFKSDICDRLYCCCPAAAASDALNDWRCLCSKPEAVGLDRSVLSPTEQQYLQNQSKKKGAYFCIVEPFIWFELQEPPKVWCNHLRLLTSLYLLSTSPITIILVPLGRSSPQTWDKSSNYPQTSPECTLNTPSSYQFPESILRT